LDSGWKFWHPLAPVKPRGGPAAERTDHEAK
jgi:hypothetical protein